MSEIATNPQGVEWERFMINENVAHLTILEVFSPKGQSTSTSYLVAPDCGHATYWIKHGNLRDRLRKGSKHCPQCAINAGTRNCKTVAEAMKDKPIEKPRAKPTFGPSDLPMDWKPPKVLRTYFQQGKPQTKAKREPGRCRDGLECPFGCEYVCQREKMMEVSHERA